MYTPARGDIFTVDNGTRRYVAVNTDSDRVLAEKMGQYKISWVRFPLTRRFNQVGEGKPREIVRPGLRG